MFAARNVFCSFECSQICQMAYVLLLATCNTGVQPVCPCNQGCPPSTSCQQNVGCCPQPQQPQRIVLLRKDSFCNFSIYNSPFLEMCNTGVQPVCPCSVGCPPTTSCQPNVGCCPQPQQPQQPQSKFRGKHDEISVHLDNYNISRFRHYHYDSVSWWWTTARIV